MKKLLLAACLAGFAMNVSADPPAMETPKAEEKIDKPDTGKTNAEAERKALAEYNRPVENGEWRNAMNSAHQVRDAAIAVIVTLVLLGSILALGALLLFTSAVAPGAVGRASVATRDHALRSFVIGAVTILVGSGLTAASKGVIGIILLPFFTAALLIGLAGVSEHVGRNVFHLGGKEGNRVGHLAAGWGVFSLVSLVPVLGWFGFLPYYTAVGVGSFFSTMFGGKVKSNEEAFGRA